MTQLMEHRSDLLDIPELNTGIVRISQVDPDTMTDGASSVAKNELDSIVPRHNNVRERYA